MKFLVGKTSEGAVSKTAPCPEAIRGPEAAAWPGEYQWFVELQTLEQLLAFLDRVGGGIGLFSANEGEDDPAIEIFDDDEDED